VANASKTWFEEHGIWVMDWPPHSPDLNPIENLWHRLKLKIFKLYPELAQHGRSKID
jgi:transposase